MMQVAAIRPIATHSEVTIPKRPDAENYKRPDVDDQRFVPDHAATLTA